jgi:hypothetical protein
MLNVELREASATAARNDQSSSRSLDDEGLGTGSPAQAVWSGSGTVPEV